MVQIVFYKQQTVSMFIFFSTDSNARHASSHPLWFKLWSPTSSPTSPKASSAPTAAGSSLARRSYCATSSVYTRAWPPGSSTSALQAPPAPSPPPRRSTDLLQLLPWRRECLCRRVNTMWILTATQGLFHLSMISRMREGVSVAWHNRNTDLFVILLVGCINSILNRFMKWTFIRDNMAMFMF